MKTFFLGFLLINTIVCAQQPKPTPLYNFMTYKTAELYKRAGDEYYINNDLLQQTPKKGNYQFERKLYEKANYYFKRINTTLLFADPGYLEYCVKVELDPATALQLFNLELQYRTSLASNNDPFFVFDELATLKEFDEKLIKDLKFYYTQLDQIQSRIDEDRNLNDELRRINDIEINPAEADADAEIEIANKKSAYYNDEVQYHKGIVGRYEGLMAASVDKQKNLSAAIKADLDKMDELGDMNASLLTSSISKFAGLPDVNQLSSFVSNPSLKNALSAAVSNGGTALLENVASSLSFAGNMVEAYKEAKTIYNTAQDFYKGTKEVVNFLRDPSINNLIGVATRLGEASGREDILSLAKTIESGKAIWGQISGCSANVTCACIEKALNTTAQQSNEVRVYLEKLKQYNFSCRTIEEVKASIENPSFDMIESIVNSNISLFGSEASAEYAKWKELRKSFSALNSNSTFDDYISIGKRIYTTLSPQNYEQLKNEVLAKKQTFLLYETLLKRDVNIAVEIVKQVKGNNTVAAKFYSLLENLLKERNITPNRLLKQIFVNTDELCSIMPDDLVGKIGAVVVPKASSCNELIGRFPDNKAFMENISFFDSVIIFAGKSIQYDLNKTISTTIDRVLAKASIPSDYQGVIKSVINHNLPQLRGKLDFGTNSVSASLSGQLFDKMLASLPSESKEDVIKDIVLTNLGLYTYGKVKDKPEFTGKLKGDLSNDAIVKYNVPGNTVGSSNPSQSEAIMNMAAQAAINYFAPGAFQAAQIISNLFMQGQYADAVQRKNEELQAEVKYYIDKSLEKDKYLSNVYRAQHEKEINDLIVKGKQRKLNSLADARKNLNFKRQEIKDQQDNKASYYYFLLERLRESFTKYLWAYRKWYGNSYQHDQIADPNSLRLILDPQIRYLSFFNYTKLGERKGKDIVERWGRIVPVLERRHQEYKVIDNRARRSEIISPIKNVVPDQWEKFRAWLKDDSRASDTVFKVKLDINLLDPVSSARWTIGFGTDLQDKLIRNQENVNLPYGLRLLGINFQFLENRHTPIEITRMFSRFNLILDAVNPPMVNYDDQFYSETHNTKPLDFRYQNEIFNISTAGINRSYHSGYWGTPLYSSYLLEMKKSMDPVANELRKSITEINVLGLYFLNQASTLNRSRSAQSPISLKIGQSSYKIQFDLPDNLNFNSDEEKVSNILEDLQKKLNRSN